MAQEDHILSVKIRYKEEVESPESGHKDLYQATAAAFIAAVIVLGVAWVASIG